VRRLEESFQVLKALFSGEAATFHGEFYTISGLTGAPEPVQRPHPPLLSGGGGRQILAVAALEADIVSFIPRSAATGPDWTTATAAATEQKLAWVREAAGERFPDLELSASIFGLVVTDDRRGAMSPLVARFGLSEDELLASPHFLIGNDEQIGDALLQHRERFGLSYFVIPEVFAEAFTPVVKRLAGT
jgi:alkanesulfonate monooxygenase SsuD/methylene tetrahydromethanopterin reductase-like flavin-dependent oxidoreductase (luciferase family)